jgi:imidazoleglycerol-phosphate dehydratase/histidinol-phosphatase
MQFGAGQLDDPRDVAVFSPCGNFPRERVGELPTELISHFFRSFVDGLGATLHIKVTGANGHHMMEATFKAVARALSSALDREAVKV